MRRDAGVAGRGVARPWRDPALTLTGERAARIDAELAGHYERAGRALSWNA